MARLSLDQISPEMRGVIFGLFATCVWGLYVPVSRHAISSGVAPEDLTFVRFAVCGLILLPWFWRPGKDNTAVAVFSRIGWWKAGVLALLAGPPFILIGATGYRFAPVSHASVIQLGMMTLGSLLLASLVLKETLSRLRIAGLCIVIFGLVIIAGHGLVAGEAGAWIGDLLFAAAGLIFALFTILIRYWSVPAFPATVAVSVISAIFYLPAYLLAGGIDPILTMPTDLLLQQVIVQGVLSGILAMVAFSQAIQLLGAARAGLFPALSPAVAILVAIPLVHELPDHIQVVGLSVATMGLIVSLYHPHPHSARPRPACPHHY